MIRKIYTPAVSDSLPLRWHNHAPPRSVLGPGGDLARQIRDSDTYLEMDQLDLIVEAAVRARIDGTRLCVCVWRGGMIQMWSSESLLFESKSASRSCV